MKNEYPLSGKDALKAITNGEVIQEKSELNFYRLNRGSLFFFSLPLKAWVKTDFDLEKDSDMYRIVPVSEIIQIGITL